MIGRTQIVFTHFVLVEYLCDSVAEKRGRGGGWSFSSWGRGALAARVPLDPGPEALLNKERNNIPCISCKQSKENS